VLCVSPGERGGKMPQLPEATAMTGSFAKSVLGAALCGSALLGLVAAGQEKGPAGASAAAEDEIIVLGRSAALLRELDRAEEAVYARFNEINSDHERFDIHCRLEPVIDSHIPRRICASNDWRTEDVNIGRAFLAEQRGEGGFPERAFHTEQQRGQKMLRDEMRRVAYEDPQFRDALARFAAARAAIAAEQTKPPSRHSVARPVEPGADGLPFGARAAFEVRAGRQPWSHPLSQRTFAIGNLLGEIRELDLHCAQGKRSLDYREGVEWTIPQSYSGCTLIVNAAPAATFDFYEFE